MRIVVTTTLTRPEYLGKTLASLETAGARDAEVLVDREGEGTRQALRDALELGQDADRLLVCQDDILCCRNLVPFCERLPIPAHVGVVNLHDFGDDFLPWENPAPSLYTFPAHRFGSGGMCGAQALLFPGDHVRWLLDQDWSAPRAPGPNASDYAVGWLTARSPRPRKLFPRPALVHHIGVISTCRQAEREARGDPHPQAPAYPLDFDCLTLLGEPIQERAAA